MKPMSVFVVDDSESDRYMLTRKLSKIGASENIFEAEDGAEALEFLSAIELNSAKFGKNFPPMITFLDVNMPKIGGFEFLKKFERLRANHEIFAKSVVVMTSSSGNIEDENRALKYDFVAAYWEKGNYTLDQLRAALETAASS